MKRVGVALLNTLPTGIVQAAAKASEEAGLEIFCLTETSTGYGKDVSSQLAAAAVRTSSIKLGTSIIPIYTRTPTLIAQLATSLSEISDGRFVLGLGSGHSSNLADNHGIIIERPLQHMREYILIVKEALTKGTLSFKGEIYNIPDLELLRPNPEFAVPIYVGVLRPKLAELAGEMADGVMLNMVTFEYLEDVIPRVQGAARRAGRDPGAVDISCFALACADPTYGELVCRERIAHYHTMPFYRKHLTDSGFGEEVEKITKAVQQGGDSEGAKYVSSRMLDALALVGDPRKWSDKLDRYRKAGIGLPIIFLFPGGPDPGESILRGINGLKT